MNSMQRLRQMTVSLPSIKDVVTSSKDGTKMLIDGWTIPYTGLLNQDSCGICHAKVLAGDSQPGFHTDPKTIIIVIEGHMEFEVSSGEDVLKFDLSVGDIAEVPADSNYKPVTYETEAEFLFISIPRWEGTPEVN